MKLPEFPYHPDPLDTGSVEKSSSRCRACGQARGYVYVGPTYGDADLAGELCPWCIADGTAAERFELGFTDIGWGVPAGVPREVLQQIETRTPGFFGWQQELWLYHCEDGAAFLGPVGRAELEPYPEALEMLRAERAADGASPEEATGYLEALSREGQPTAFLFRCLHCGRHLAYSDFG